MLLPLRGEVTAIVEGRPAEAGDARAQASAALGAGPVPSHPSLPWKAHQSHFRPNLSLSKESCPFWKSKAGPARVGLRPWPRLPVRQGWPGDPVLWLDVRGGIAVTARR